MMQSIPEAILDWSKLSSIQSKKIPELFTNDGKDIFPVSSQPLIKFIESREDICQSSSNSLIENPRAWILTQSFYHYFNELSSLETKLICTANAGIISDSYTVKFDRDFKQIASTIIIDEGFHSFCSLNAVRQVEDQTGIKPIKLNKKNSAEHIFGCCRKMVEHQYWNDFTLVIASILEAILAKDLDLCLRAKNRNENLNTNAFFYMLQESHLRDESRHSCFALLTLESLWGNINDTERSNLLPAIHRFVELYSAFVSFGDNEFNSKMVTELGFDDLTATDASKFYVEYKRLDAKQLHNSMLNLLNQTKVFTA